MTAMNRTQDRTEVQTDAPARLKTVLQDIAQACAKARRDPAEVTLVAVSKTFGAAAIAPVLAAGQRGFGGNRVQEAGAKWPALKAGHPGNAVLLGGAVETKNAKGGVASFSAL